MILLTEQQKKDAAECEKMMEQGKDKECFGCSCSVCILNCRVNKLAKAAPEMLEALKVLKQDIQVDRCTKIPNEAAELYLSRIEKAIAKAEGRDDK